MTYLDPELLKSEEAKRDRNWDPAARWKVIEATITWAEQQATVRRNTPEACRANEARLLQELERWKQKQKAAPLQNESS